MRQYLIIDGDDTLWENAIYFDRAIDEFIQFLDHSSLTPKEVRAVLHEIEATNTKVHGYGSANFARNLLECFERLAEHEIHDSHVERVRFFGEQLLRHPMHVLEGVEETLYYLHARHHLVMLTKGELEEQNIKIEASGLKQFFQEVIVVKEKDCSTYADIIHRHGVDASIGWMIGNSPRSDINPALEVGLNAVYIPHNATWHVERQEIRYGSGRLMTLEKFPDLQDHF